MTVREDLEKLTVGANPNPACAVLLADAHYALANNFRYVMNEPVPEEERVALAEFAFEALRAWLPSIDQATIDQLRPRFEGRGTRLDLDARTRVLVSDKQRDYDEWLEANEEVIPSNLAALIENDPDSLDAYRVLGDAMIDAGYARGELIAAQLDDPQHEAHLVPLIAYMHEPWKTELGWRAGFLRSASIGIFDPADLAAKGRVNELLEMLLRHPAARFLVDLTIRQVGYAHEADDLEEVAHTIGRSAPATLRHLRLGDFNSPREGDISAQRVGNVTAALVPHLRGLTIQGAGIKLDHLRLPQLEHLAVLTGGLDGATARVIAGANLPGMVDLELWFGSPEYGCTTTLDDIAPLFQRAIPSVALRNCSDADDLCRRLLGTSLLRHARRLDLSMGTMTDLGARVISDHRDQFAHLVELDLEDNYLSPDALEMLKDLKVTGADQRDAEEGAHYVSVGE